MHAEAKYLIHADITADGVVERSDVVGAVFGQTEGLLGDDLDLRHLQDASKVGRIDVDVESERGQSFGEITIASGLDRVETAILAASLETIERVGPCRATVEVSGLEDVRSAKRRAVVDRAVDLLADLEADAVTSRDIVDEVRRRVRVEDLAEYEGLPAGPHVPESDAVVVVEGRADVLTLLEYGVKNAVAVEGTNVPDAVADLTRERTATAFLDGDRGGELILRELAQVGDVDYVAFAPDGTAVEDLDRETALSALRQKVPYQSVADGTDAARAAGAAPEPRGADDERAVPTDGGTAVTPDPTAGHAGPDGPTGPSGPDADAGGDDAATAETEPGADARGDATTDSVDPVDEGPGGDAAGATGPDDGTALDALATLGDHVRDVIREGSGTARLLDADANVLAEGPADEAFDLVEAADTVPATLVVDATVEQRHLDVAAQRGVDRVVGASTGEFVKRPTAVRVLTAADF